MTPLAAMLAMYFAVGLFLAGGQLWCACPSCRTSVSFRVWRVALLFWAWPVCALVEVWWAVRR